MLNKAKKSIRNIRAKQEDRAYHEKSINNALRALKSLERQRGPLPENIKKKCDEYSVDVLGSRNYAPWFYVYSRVAGEFREGWLAPNYWGRIIVPKIQGQHGRISGLKSMSRIIFRSDRFPDLLTYANGIFSDSDGQVFSPSEAKSFLFSSRERVVFKSDMSRKGMGVWIFDPESFKPAEFMEKTSESGVFQSFIDQDAGLSAFFSEAVSTLRLNTVLNTEGLVELRSAHLRLGTGEDTRVTDASQIRIAVCLNTGRLSDTGFTGGWVEVDRHTDTGVPFSGFDYPMFREAVEVVKRLHRVVPFVRCIGWDVCVDRSGEVCVMEWNGRQNGIQFPEATQGPCFLGLGW